MTKPLPSLNRNREDNFNHQPDVGSVPSAAAGISLTFSQKNDMRQVILDPQETDVPESEQFVGIATASKDEYKDLEDFITRSGDHFPFNKIDSPRRRTACPSGDLLRFIAPIREAYPKEGVPLPTQAGFKYADDWNYKDFVFETEDRFVRVVWTTTA